ncbi:hypothetical protein [Anaerotignum lactatifermentans]|uniref:hypothetical protein n=1 Tax=Anaerotignum lactatifermentans TaxID=160404 RepID=UPI00242E3952|nr:hypothetical protein [Anaerotignum lactatifermentans]
MKRNRITNVIIVVLVIAAVYQTGELWLEGTAGHNFFRAVKESISATDEASESDALLATRYAVGDGASNFSVYYPDKVGSSDMLEKANDVLQEILAENIGESTELEKADWKEMLQNKCIVMQYDFMINMDDYLEGMRSLKNGQDLDSFDYITIVPARRTGEESKAYFVNSQTNDCVVYRAMKSKSAPILFEALQAETEGEMVYISTGQKTSSAVLRRNLFLPQWAELPYQYDTLRQVPAFEQEGAVSRMLLENTAERFFRNFSVDWSQRDENGNFVFSDSSVVLRYNPGSRMLEYYNYENYGSDGPKTALLDGYQISCNFMTNDASLQTDVYLADIGGSGNETVYYFDYAVNGLPVYLSESVQQEIGMKHAIEVTVSNNSVKKYRRYAVNYEASGAKDASLDVQFIDALDAANRLYQETVEQREIADVKNIALGYFADRTEGIRLQWFVNLYDRIFLIETDSTLPEQTAVTETEPETVVNASTNS